MNISVVLPSSSVKIWEKSVKGFMSYDQTHKQTKITTLCEYRFVSVFTLVSSILSSLSNNNSPGRIFICLQ